MGLRVLNWDTLPTLDSGKAAEGFQMLVEQATQDCINLPLVTKPRIVTLQFELTPVADTEGNIVTCCGAKGRFTLKLKVPDRKVKEVDFAVRRDGSLVFNPDSPEDHRQRTLLPTDDES